MIIPPGYKADHVSLVGWCIPPGARVVEVGAGAGVVTEAIAAVAAAVAAYEPIRVMADAARVRVGHLPHVAVIESAVGPPSCAGTVDLHEMSEPWNSGVSIPPYDRPVRSVTVPCRAIDEATTMAEADAVVLDCEGYEVELLVAHLPPAVRTLMVEWHPHVVGPEPVLLAKAWLRDDGWVAVSSRLGELRPGGYAELTVYRR